MVFGLVKFHLTSWEEKALVGKKKRKKMQRHSWSSFVYIQKSIVMPDSLCLQIEIYHESL